VTLHNRTLRQLLEVVGAAAVLVGLTIALAGAVLIGWAAR